MDRREAAAKLGIRGDIADEAVQTDFTGPTGGPQFLDDLAMFDSARRDVEGFPRLMSEVAALKADRKKIRYFLDFLAESIGVHLSGADFTDDELKDLLALTAEGDSIRIGKIAALVKVLLALDDRDMRRMDFLSQKKNAWRSFLFYAEDIEDKLLKRTDLKDDPRIYQLWHDLNRAISHFKIHAKLAVAILNPDENPHELFDVLCRRAAKASFPKAQNFVEVRKAVGKLLDRATRQEAGARTT